MKINHHRFNVQSNYYESYYNTKIDNRNTIIMEMFPELTYIGEYVFNMNLETLKEKLLNKFSYSVDQVKIEVNSLTHDDDEVLTYQKLVELFHQKFEFEDEHDKSDDNMIHYQLKMILK